MAYIHLYFLSPSTCIGDTQLSSSGARLFSLQFFFAIALQKLLCARQVVCDLKPIEKAPCPRSMLFFFFNILWFLSLTIGASTLPKNPCMLQQRGLLLLPPGDHLHMVNVGDASWSFAHTIATVSPDREAVGWRFIYFFSWQFLGFLLIIFLCKVFFYYSFAKKAPFSWVCQKPGAADCDAIAIVAAT